MEPVQKTRLYSQIVERIKEQIREGKYKPGGRIPSERELAAMLRVGRSSIREAMTVLESIGLLEIRPGEGTFVRDFKQENSLKTFFDTFVTLWEIEPSQILQLLQVRRMLEPETAALAATAATEQDLAELGGLLEEMKEAAREGKVGEDLDFRFHYVLARSTGNVILVDIINALSDLMHKALQQVRWMALFNPQRVSQIIAEHQCIMRALAGKDAPLARQYMLKHLNGVESNYKRYLKEV